MERQGRYLRSQKLEGEAEAGRAASTRITLDFPSRPPATFSGWPGEERERGQVSAGFPPGEAVIVWGSSLPGSSLSSREPGASSALRSSPPLPSSTCLPHLALLFLCPSSLGTQTLPPSRPRLHPRSTSPVLPQTLCPFSRGAQTGRLSCLIASDTWPWFPDFQGLLSSIFAFPLLCFAALFHPFHTLVSFASVIQVQTWSRLPQCYLNIFGSF